MCKIEGSMRISVPFLMSLSCIVGACLSAGAFSTTSSMGGEVHDQIIKEALTGTVCDANIKFMNDASDSQDAPGTSAASEARRHFNDANLASAMAYLDRERKQALNYAGNADTDPDDRAQCLRHLGLLLHTAQDFYSRSNYIELQLQNPNKRVDPYNIDLIDWGKLQAGQVGDLACGNPDLNKDNATTGEGKRVVGKATYFSVARDLALRETQRQWNLFESLIRTRFNNRAPAIIAALKNASIAEGSTLDSLLDKDSDGSKLNLKAPEPEKEPD
jgi:hypothetical protein